MASQGAGLTGRQPRAVEALLACPTIKAAAQEAKVSYRTLRGWLRLPAFLAAVREGRRELVEAGLGRLQQATGRAVKTLVACLKAAKDGDKIKASLGILDRATKAVELIDLVERVEELEQRAQEQTDRGEGR
jgi:hypothetical protein